MSFLLTTLWDERNTLSSMAVLSPCRSYRYELWRRWGSGGTCTFIGLNPSTADETNDDPTIRRCVGFAKEWGYGSLCMVNLFAFRATQPKDMMSAADPIGPENDATLEKVFTGSGMVIAAWGNHGKHLNRGRDVLEKFPDIHFLKLNSDGSPAHPLYLPKSLTPTRFIV